MFAFGEDVYKRQMQTEEITTEEDTASTKGIKAGGNLSISGGTFNIDSADDALHSNSDISITDGTYEIATGDDGVHADSAVEISGGTINITQSYEGIEGLTVTISGGEILSLIHI